MTANGQEDGPILWRCCDVAGHEMCALSHDTHGPVFRGHAVWADSAGSAGLTYLIRCTADWILHSARVEGLVGSRDIDLDLRRDGSGRWHVNGQPRPEFDGLRDLDLGFTPATNTCAIRRLRLAVGAEGQSRAVWLDTDDWRMKPLDQSYRRVADRRYLYRSPAHGFEAELTVRGDGLVTDYPGLWRVEP